LKLPRPEKVIDGAQIGERGTFVRRVTFTVLLSHGIAEDRETKENVRGMRNDCCDPLIFGNDACCPTSNAALRTYRGAHTGSFVPTYEGKYVLDVMGICRLGLSLVENLSNSIDNATLFTS